MIISNDLQIVDRWFMWRLAWASFSECFELSGTQHSTNSVGFIHGLLLERSKTCSAGICWPPLSMTTKSSLMQCADHSPGEESLRELWKLSYCGELDVGPGCGLSFGTTLGQACTKECLLSRFHWFFLSHRWWEFANASEEAWVVIRASMLLRFAEICLFQRWILAISKVFFLNSWIGRAYFA